MSISNIRAVVSQLPQLTDFGVGIFQNGRGLSEVERNKKIKEEQEALIQSVEAFNKTCSWLSQIDKLKNINYKHSSYGLKHIAENDIGYITNGVFIAAAIHCGFEFKTEFGSPNVCFNMSEKSIKNAEKRI